MERRGQDPGWRQQAAERLDQVLALPMLVLTVVFVAVLVLPDADGAGHLTSAEPANTSREIGAVLGVAVLGALVNSQLHADLTGRLRQLGIPANFQAIVINAIETGTVPPNSQAASAGGAAGQGRAKLVQDVIHAAYAAFYSGLQAALFVSAGLVLAAGLFTFIMVSKPSTLPGDASNPLLVNASGPRRGR